MLNQKWCAEHIIQKASDNPSWPCPRSAETAWLLAESRSGPVWTKKQKQCLMQLNWRRMLHTTYAECRNTDCEREKEDIPARTKERNWEGNDDQNDQPDDEPQRISHSAEDNL